MNEREPLIRKIRRSDNNAIARVIRQVLDDFGVPRTGTTYADKALDTLYEYYEKPRSVYYVIEEKGQIIGGGGIAPLENYKGNVCELQKLYFLKKARGRGLGGKLIRLCLKDAKEMKFDSCYLETMGYMDAALGIYEKYGFTYLDSPMGDTGHSSCEVWMLKIL